MTSDQDNDILTIEDSQSFQKAKIQQLNNPVYEVMDIIIENEIRI